MTVMDNPQQSERPEAAYQRAVLAALGPLAEPATGFVWPDRLFSIPVICIGLGGTHVVFWTEPSPT